jgi:hypothetical protein
VKYRAGGPDHEQTRFERGLEQIEEKRHIRQEGGKGIRLSVNDDHRQEERSQVLLVFKLLVDAEKCLKPCVGRCSQQYAI